MAVDQTVIPHLSEKYLYAAPLEKRQYLFELIHARALVFFQESSQCLFVHLFSPYPLQNPATSSPKAFSIS